ncbi:transcriptional regulator, MarR family [Catenulispora acidiphila DSM 44928]|uniref:Transcriptional regulator, MarR family n=1 Tax=Catenulispora acidiphila (strain DSM 44928 / JCM 14897 / NBRC 102108 / NRRL B-24433 / ID139908) TaxID=479433 RepID=C7QF97_CATAD|nr:MarR family transcriptional regulator [Catenulispora acidiphila]ACU76674.1 transcriptional regulator, MarR family [Catenulispora acidiphila DSM 44928]
MSDYPSKDAYRAHAAMQKLVLHQRDMRGAVEKATGVSFGRGRALRRLVDGPLRMSELAARLGWDKPYTTTVVDDLEERGLVTRNVAPDDRRAKMVELTPDGHAVAVTAIQILAEPAPGLARLNAEELAVVADLLEKASVENEY